MEVFFAKVVYTKGGLLRFISHRDIIEIVKRAVVRSEIPVSFSQGFNPRPNISYFNPLQLGVASDCEVLLLHLTTYIKPAVLLEQLNTELVSGLICTEADYVRSKKSIRIIASAYELPVSEDETVTINEKAAWALGPEAFIIKDRNKKKVMLHDKIKDCRIDRGLLKFVIANNSEGSVSTLEFLKVFFDENIAAQKLFKLKRVSTMEGGRLSG